MVLCFLSFVVKQPEPLKKDFSTTSYPEIRGSLLFEKLYPHPNPLSGKEREF
jgi:hypothetical protein